MGPAEINELPPKKYHDKILESVKAQVKAIMEESVTRKFVHEESEHVLRLCVIIHNCLLEHLRKRTAGFLRSNKTANLFNKVGRSLPEIAQLVSKIEETQLSIESQLARNGKTDRTQSLQQRHLKHLWVRLALTEKKMDKILEFLVENCKKFYEKDSIFCDPVRGRILSSLLVGPCALEYTKMKTSDHYWSDPPADELLQRHKLHCRHEEQLHGRPKLPLSRYSSMEPTEKSSGVGEAGKNFREYVESLHQNSKSTLLYGKNNVIVQPRDEMKPIHGYLSLHQVLDSLFIKWTPNQLMNVNEQEKSVNCNHDSERLNEDGQNEESRHPLTQKDDMNNVIHKRPDTFLRRDQPNDNHANVLARDVHKTTNRLLIVNARWDANDGFTEVTQHGSYWEYAISVNVKDIVYLHCHQKSDAKGTLVLVGQDGVQRPPICFPPGGHLLAFLTCLETGLLPLGHLDPPLWLQRGKGKVFPRLRNRSSQSSTSTSSGSFDAVETTDFVFRVTSGRPKTINSATSVLAAETSFVQPILSNAAIPDTITPTFSSLYRDCASTEKSEDTTISHQRIARSVVISKNLTTGTAPLYNALYVNSMNSPAFARLLPISLLGEYDDNDIDFVGLSSHGPVTVQPPAEIIPIQENFDAYDIGPGYTCYDSTEQSYSSRSSLKVLCDTMRRQIVSRAFYGWLAHCRHLSTVRTHLSALVLPDRNPLPLEQASPINSETWNSFLLNGRLSNTDTFMKRVYFGGIEHEMRNVLWPFLLNHYPMDSNWEEREKIDAEALDDYRSVVSEWKVAEKIVIEQRQRESLAAKLSCESCASSMSSLDCPPKQVMQAMRQQSTMSDVFTSLEKDTSEMSHQSWDSSHDKGSGSIHNQLIRKQYAMNDKLNQNKLAGEHTPYSSVSTETSNVARQQSSTTVSSSVMDAEDSINEETKLGDIIETHLETEQNGIETNAKGSESESSHHKAPLTKQDGIDMGTSQDLGDNDKSYTQQESSTFQLSEELVENFGLNLHRIEKDVHRCDRNHEYFSTAENLEKLQNIMCSYVWRNLKSGYMQGMCDLAAPLLLLMDDESKVFSCFTQLMKRMEGNFPTGNAMDAHFANMRSLLQVLDSELFERMNENGEYTHFYFCYRWFLLDFKRELSYDNDVFAVWETIWAARHVCSEQFVLFFALALLHNYRDIILDNEMDFVDMIKFFNEMAERHKAGHILKLAQSFVYEVQSLISK